MSSDLDSKVTTLQVMSPITETIPGSRPPLHGTGRRPDLRIVGLAMVSLIGGGSYIALGMHPRQGLLFLIGGALGLVLYHALFGFTNAWRAFVFDGRGAGIRSHMLLLGATTFLFLPFLAKGSILGNPVQGSVAPIGVAVIVGAFLFGIGMQLGGG